MHKRPAGLTCHMIQQEIPKMRNPERRNPVTSGRRSPGCGAVTAHSQARCDVAATPATAATGRRGVLVVEMIVCAVLLSVVALILIPGLQAVGKQRQAIQFETLALIELNNLQQELLHRAPEPLHIGRLQLSQWFQRRYPGASVLAEAVPPTATEPDAPLTAVRLTVRRSAGANTSEGRWSLVVWLPGKPESGVRDPASSEGTAR